MRRFALITTLLAVGAIGACGPGFEPAYKLEKSRIIGAFVSVDSDPLRATPGPGETATLTLVAADPGPKAGRTYALVVCRKGPSNLDVVFCTDPATFLGTNLVTTLPGAADPKPDPTVSFTLPSEAELGEDDEVWVFGAVCNGGQVRDLINDPPQYGTNWDPCEPNQTPTPYGQLISSRLPIARLPERTNRRPSFASVRIDDADFVAVPPDDASDIGCIGAGYPEFPADSLHAISATAMPDDREPYFNDFLQADDVEDVYLRLYLTAGKPDVTYAVIEDTMYEAGILYRTPPAVEVDDTGTLVRFWLYLDDDRHASSWVRRAICVTK